MCLDGGMLNGSAFMREPWPRGDTYQVTEDDYRGLLFIKPEQLKVVVEEAAQSQFAAPEGFTELERRRYDDTEFTFLRAAAS